ncbi:MAG: hypothetical protein WD512_08870 [Candidatus Paceibacterota bacterium]
MSLFDISPQVLNPILVSRLDGNVEASILLRCLERWCRDKADESGWANFTRSELQELTGLTENKIKVSVRLLKRKEILQTKVKKGIRFYKIDSIKIEKLSGFQLRPTILKKLDNNAKAALLLVYYLEFNQDNKISLFAEIPSKVIEIATGMDENAQIYARDSLLGMNLLRRLSENEYSYVLNIEQLVEKKIVVVENA